MGQVMTETTENDKPTRTRKQWIPVFLAQLAATGNVSIAAEKADIDRTHTYNWRYKHEDFAAQWDEAMQVAVDALEAEARRRAVEGVDEPVYYKGQLVDTIKKYSDTLLITLLKAHRPEKFRERFEHTGADGGPLRIDSTVHHPDPEVLAEILAVRERTGDVETGDKEANEG